MKTTIDYTAQALRLKDKLPLAREKDPQFLVFGARKHKYRLDPPLSEGRLTELERMYGVSLPPDLRAFLTTVGNGLQESSYWETGGAGPFYGLQAAETILKYAGQDQAPLITTDLTSEEWNGLEERALNDEIDLDELTRGCAGIVSRGCSFLNLIVLTGSERGRVIYYDEEGSKPFFAWENNFLDWYERWLDEVISGDLVKEHAPEFGITPGGDADHLFLQYEAAKTAHTRQEILSAFHRFSTLEPAHVEQLREIATAESGAPKVTAVQVLVEFAPDVARQFISDLCGDETLDLSPLFWSMNRTAGGLCRDFDQEIAARLRRISKHKEFFAGVWLLKIHHPEFDDFIAPLAKHDEAPFRETVMFALKDAKEKTRHLPVFVNALQDEDAAVVRNALQATENWCPPEIAATFPEIRQRCLDRTWDENGYVAMNLRRREQQARGLWGRLRKLFRR